MNDNFNGYSNFKGVMLCVRPQDKAKITYEKPFCSRVDNKDLVGLNPCKKKNKIKRKKIIKNFKIFKHKEFLKNLENEIQNKKMNYIDSIIKKKEDQDKLRDTMQIKRNIIRGIVVPDNIIKIDKVKIDNNQKPDWALTKKENENKEEKDGIDLINFIDEFDCEKYLKDIESKTLIDTLNKKIENIKKEENWMDILDKRVKNKHEKENEIEKDLKIRNLERNLSEDNLFVNNDDYEENIKESNDENKLNKSDILENNEDKICYNLAKEILKNNKAMAHIHSNLSLQKILEKERLKNKLIIN